MVGKIIESEDFDVYSDSIEICGVALDQWAVSYEVTPKATIRVLLSKRMYDLYEKHFLDKEVVITDTEYNITFVPPQAICDHYYTTEWKGSKYMVLCFKQEPKHVVVDVVNSVVYFAEDDDALNALERRLSFETSGEGFVSISTISYIGNAEAIRQGNTAIKEGEDFVRSCIPGFLDVLGEPKEEDYDCFEDYIEALSNYDTSDYAMYYVFMLKK